MEKEDFRIDKIAVGKWAITHLPTQQVSVEYKKRSTAETVVYNIIAGIDRTFDHNVDVIQSGNSIINKLCSTGRG